MTLSKHDISEYYSDPAVRKNLLKQIKDKPVLAVFKAPTGENIYRRNASDGNPIRITHAELDPSARNDLSWYTDRRYTEFHPVIGKTTNQLWVDIDPGKSKTIDDVKPIVTSVADTVSKLPNVRDVQIAYSGGRGFYVKGDLRKEQDTYSVRKQLERALKKDFSDTKGVVFDTPKANQVRLDTSTLHNKGSIRALYSINSDTGNVSLPLSLNTLSEFNPEDANVKKILEQRSAAPGIPASKRVHVLPEKAKEKEWMLSVQEHQAERAGKHWDLRLVDPHTGFAHSWAVPKATFPTAKPVLAIPMPTHTSDYALNFGAKKREHITEGYGKGSVRIKHKEPVNILQVSPEKIKFERTGKSPETFTLFKTNEKQWLLKKGHDMRSVYEQGYRDGLRKLGIDSSTVSEPLSEDQQTEDSGLPADQLAKALAQMEDVRDQRDPKPTKYESSDEKLNKDVTWTSPIDIPSGFMQGPTTPIIGGNF